LVPLDAARALEHAHAFGSLHDAFYTTSGVDTPIAVAARHGQEIAADLRESQVGAVILTGT
jgi:glycine reductase